MLAKHKYANYADSNGLNSMQTRETQLKSSLYQAALDQHGLILGADTIQDIVKQITNRKAKFIQWSSHNGYRSYYQVKIYGQLYLVLYDFELESLVTIYNNSWIKRFNQGKEPDAY